MPPEPPVLHQVNVIVRDMAASVRFFERLGLTVDGTDPAWMAHHRTVRAGDTLELELDSVEFARTWNRGWPVREGTGPVLTFRVATRAAVDALFARMTDAGYRAQQPPYDAFWGARFAIIEDPDGHAIGLTSPASAAHRTPPPLPPGDAIERD